jgi:serine/threonine-protein kinase
MAVQNVMQDTFYLQGLLQREYVTDREIKKCLRLQDEAYRAGRKNLSLLDILTEAGFISPSQAERIKSDIEQGRNFNLHIPGYRIIKKLGEGGMGVVYLARQSSLQRDVALKVLRENFSNDRGFLERFRREAITVAQINHPHIVGVIDVGVESGGKQYIVMEYIDGVDLLMELQKLGRYDELEAARVGLDVARALAHVHRIGFIHRDVKPQNVMIGKERIAKLTDMGLARHMDDEKMKDKEKGKALGTPDYISPEQIRGELDLDHRVDQYALGATLFHLVTGRVPFVADTPVRVMGKHMEEPLTPPAQLVPELTGGLSEVIEVLMGKRRSDRYANTEDLVIDLESIVLGQKPRLAMEKLGRPLPPPPLPPPDVLAAAASAADPVAPADAAASSASSASASAVPTVPAWLWIVLAVSVLANVGIALMLMRAQH